MPPKNYPGSSTGKIHALPLDENQGCYLEIARDAHGTFLESSMRTAKEALARVAQEVPGDKKIQIMLTPDAMKKCEVKKILSTNGATITNFASTYKVDIYFITKKMRRHHVNHSSQTL